MASSKNQSVENKMVNKCFNRLGWGKNSICENAGITRHIHESKRDTRSAWREFTANPWCLRKIRKLSSQPQNVIERKGVGRC
jgi:hypothetical protein